MNCKLKLLLGLLLYCAVAYLAAEYVPPEWGGYGAMVLFIVIFGALVFGWFISVIRHVRNPYEGAQNLRRQARQVARDENIDINTAAQEVWDQAQAKGETFPKRELDALPRPVMVDRAHIQYIRSNETMPLAGYDRTPAKDPERFGVVQQPGLPAGKEAEGIRVDLPEKQPSPIRRR